MDVRHGMSIIFDQPHPDVEEITGHPEDTIRQFVKFLRELEPRYNEALRLYDEYNDKQNDILHYIELHPNMNARDGYKAYKLIADVRRERRKLQIETEMIGEIIKAIDCHFDHLAERLSALQGQVRSKREKIECRSYRFRTDVLDETQQQDVCPFDLDDSELVIDQDDLLNEEDNYV